MFVDGEHEYEPDGVAVQFHLLSEEVAGWLALHSPEDRGAAGRELLSAAAGCLEFWACYVAEAPAADRAPEVVS